MYVVRILWWIGMIVSFFGIIYGLMNDDMMLALINTFLGAINHKSLLDHIAAYPD